ncbi:hypothetical protein D3C78_1499140 [compost metagenome]
MGDIEQYGLTDADEGGADRGKDEKRHRQLVGGNAGVASAHAVAAHGEDPVSEGRIMDIEDIDRRQQQPPDDTDLKTAADELSEQEFSDWAGLGRT